MFVPMPHISFWDTSGVSPWEVRRTSYRRHMCTRKNGAFSCQYPYVRDFGVLGLDRLVVIRSLHPNIRILEFAVRREVSIWEVFLASLRPRTNQL